MNKPKYSLTPIVKLLIGIIFILGMVPLAFAEVTINVMAVNGSPTKKDTTVRFNLPSDLTAPDVLDTDGLQLDYNVEYANFYVHGQVVLEPKQSKTFKIRVRDIWKIDEDKIQQVKSEIDEGYKKLGVPHDPKMADQLKEYLLKKIDYIVDAQTTKAEGVERRIDSFRAYDKEMRRIKANALAVDYWRSDLNEVVQPKLVHLNIEVENPASSKSKSVKYRQFLPVEVKPEHVIESEGFEVRYDQQRQQAFLFKEEDIPPGEKRKYNVGIQDIWTISPKELDYYKSRTDYAYEFLKDSRFKDSAKILNDRILENLKAVEDSQAQVKPILEHISVYRDNQKIFNQAGMDLQTLEKLLAVFRENLEKSKVNNVLQKVEALNSISSVSNALFGKKVDNNVAFNYIIWIAGFVGVVTGVAFFIWLLRSKDKNIVNEEDVKEAKPTDKKE